MKLILIILFFFPVTKTPFNIVILTFSVINILKFFSSEWFTMNVGSVHRTAEFPPWRKSIFLQNCSLDKITIGSVATIFSAPALLGKKSHSGFNPL